MTSNHFSRVMVSFMWSLLYMLPLLVFIGVSIRNGSLTTFDSVFSTLGLTFVNDNIIYQAFDSIFGVSGVLPLFADNGVILFATYFACCYLLHFICDVVLWLVRWAHDLMNKGGKDLWK